MTQKGVAFIKRANEAAMVFVHTNRIACAMVIKRLEKGAAVAFLLSENRIFGVRKRFDVETRGRGAN